MPAKPLLYAAVLMLGACAPAQPEAPVSELDIRLPAVAGNPGVAYFTLSGGSDGRTLVSVSSPDAARAEMHDMTMKNGMMSMAQIKGGLLVPAKSEVRFAPGGKHVMLFGMKPSLKKGAPVTLSFTFANGETITLSTPAGAPGGGGMHHHSE